ncbi:MAG: HlyD family efflux transporter periplasmic adaptor subunit [Elusimicrobiota bacterium]|jgi:HlyD family secretion protein|nr:HlyD family efflux transporter periplasmic adaptor subunit [Elusimicrobiota bacterium]
MRKIAITAIIILLVLVAVSLIFFRRVSFSYSGVVEAVEVGVSSRLNDVIIKLNVEEGSPVEAGQILAELECKDANLQADIAVKEFKRAEELLKTSAGSRENYDLRKSRSDSARLAQSWCKITSPLTGKVLYKYYQQGEFIPAGRKLVSVADLSRVDAWVYVPHDMLAQLSLGQNITGSLPETGQSYRGKIIAINDEAEFTPKNVQTRQERQRLVFGVKTRFENDETQTLKPGMTLEVLWK